MRLIDAEGLERDRVENDPVRIAAKCVLTAYDVDQVVKRLCAERRRWLDSYEEYGDGRELGVAKGPELAIKVVKSGIV